VSERGEIIARRWIDAFGKEQVISDASRQAVAAAMGDDAPPPGVHPDPVRLVHPGDPVDAGGEVTLEDGTALGAIDRLPDDLPPGYHHLATDLGEQLLILAPPRCHLPDGLRAWGWSAQLATSRSRASWGIGDLDDLRRLAAWSDAVGASVLQVSPLGAPTPRSRPEPSPYFPASRRFRSVLHLAVPQVPGAQAIAGQLAPLVAAGEALNTDRLVDRERVLATKLHALELVWGSGAGKTATAQAGIEVLRHDLGDALHQWAAYAAIGERHEGDWRRWPEPLRNPAGTEVAVLAAELADRVAFHEWVQWLLDEQLRVAGEQGPALVHDLPIGFDPGGFDAWTWQQELANGAWLGAPPDLLSREGQEWGLPPFSPRRLRAAGYRPFIETLRAVLRHAGGLRIDHAAGLFRAWWVPAGSASSLGAYVRYPSEELLSVLALESVRAGAWIVGEDLGTIEAGVRETLTARDILSMRVVYFEEAPPATYPYRALAVVGTHDLPTVAGIWTGADLADQERAGVPPDHAGDRLLHDALGRITGLPAEADPHDVILAAYGGLAGAPSAVVTATLEDALALPDRVNLPGTIERQRPNWSIALPRPIDDLEGDTFAAKLAAELRAARPSPAD